MNTMELQRSRYMLTIAVILAIAMAAQAAPVVWNSAPPTVDGADIANFVGC